MLALVVGNNIFYLPVYLLLSQRFYPCSIFAKWCCELLCILCVCKFLNICVKRDSTQLKITRLSVRKVFWRFWGHWILLSLVSRFSRILWDRSRNNRNSPMLHLAYYIIIECGTKGCSRNLPGEGPQFRKYNKKLSLDGFSNYIWIVGYLFFHPLFLK